MNINLVDFLELITYNQLFDHVCLSSKLGAAISLADEKHEICFVESINFDTCDVWYPISSWINECKRRKDIESTLLDFRSRPKKIVKDDKKELMKLLTKAAMCGNIAEVTRITERLSKL